MDSFKVVVIITTYNTSDYLKDTIDSVLNNSYKNLEIILVDDGSTDNSVEICKEYVSRNSRIHLITQKNSGVSSARNAGLNYAFELKADAVHFLDGDDYVNKDFYKNLTEVLIDESADAVCCSVYNEKTSFLDVQPAIGHLGLLGKLSVNNGWMKGAWAFLYRTDLLKQYQDLRFDTNFSYGEDCIFVVKSLYYSRKVAVAPEAIYYYRYNLKSVTKSQRTKEQNENIYRQQILVGEILDNFAKEKQIPQVLWERHKLNNSRRQQQYCEDLVDPSIFNTPSPYGFIYKMCIRLCCLFLIRKKDRKKFRQKFLGKK